MQNFWYPPGSASASSITANQGTPTTDANAWPVKVTNGVNEANVNPDGSLDVNIITGLANPLPVQDSAAEASLASLAAKTASSSVTVPFDYQDITYVGATDRIDQVIYKSGGAGGTVVATLTMGYDGSNRLISVTKT